LAALLRRATVVEFVDRDDPMTKRLLANKPAGLFDDYRLDAFEKLLGERFSVDKREVLPSGTRTLFLATPCDRTPARRCRAGVGAHEGLYLIEILALCSFAFTRPILQIFGDDPQTFLAQGASRTRSCSSPSRARSRRSPSGRRGLTRLLGLRVRGSSRPPSSAAWRRSSPTRRWRVPPDGRPSPPGVCRWSRGAAVAALFWSAAPFRSFLHFASLSAPVFRGALRGRLPRLPDLRVVELPCRTCPVEEPGALAGVRRTAHRLAARRSRPDRRRPLPELRRSRERRHVVPQQHDRRDDHPERGAGDHDGPVRDGSHTPRVVDYPDSIFTLLGRSYRMHVSERVTHVCPGSLCAPANGKGLGSQISSLFGDAPRSGRSTRRR